VTGSVSPHVHLYSVIAKLICRLERAVELGTDVITWASPVASFGSLANARVATVGLNPSNREFVDQRGYELTGESRRFHSLASLGLESWLDVDVRHLREIALSCDEYFTINPYDVWFKPLDYIASGAGGRFYGAGANACHLDLIPFATAQKWTDLSSEQRAKLLDISGDSLALLVRESPVRTVILNGQAVVEHFQLISGIRLLKEEIPESTLPRRTGRDVLGFGYRGVVCSLCDIALEEPILILGYNHNLQSSFGVTRAAMEAIRAWLTRACEERV
jgi:hypothetical protein